MLQLRITAVSALTEEQKNEIWEMLVLADKEFVPPLSERRNTLQTQWETHEIEALNVPTVYYEIMLKQEFVLALDEAKVVGFMSYIPEKQIELENGKGIVADYVSTIIVHPEYRSNGITRALYNYLLAQKSEGFIATRTWSTNDAHLHILEKMGFQNIWTIKNDRAEGIDTVYYCRKR